MKKRDLALMVLARIEGRLEALEQQVRSLERQLAEERAIRHCPATTPDYYWPATTPAIPMFPLIYPTGTGEMGPYTVPPVTTSGGEG